MELSVAHVTTFRYTGPVRDSVNEVRLSPRTDAQQVCLDFRLTTDPPSESRAYTDYFGNTVHTFDISEPHTRLTIVARSRVITQAPELPADLAALPDPYAPLAMDRAGELGEFLQATARTPVDPAIRAFAVGVRDAEPLGGLGALVWRLSHALHERFEYVPGATDVGTIASEAFAACRGVCQDYTHVALAALRLLGVPARYTSGYFHPEGARGEVGEQASHAWVEVWLPRSGWVGVDPSNDRVVNDRYIRVAYGRDYADVTPIKGSYRGMGSSTLDVDVRVGAGGQQQQ
ncbi:MAG: transglutaminase family protein [Candidatus Rokuibacteriota bacterium]